eukprot:16360613-Heterocapsa_arctica.AAC.1
MSFRAAVSDALPQRTIDVFAGLYERIRSTAWASTRFATAMALFAPIGDLHREDVTDGRTGT